jgi:hypothetical protein
MKHGLKLLTGSLLAAAVLGCGPASAGIVSGDTGSVWTNLVGYGSGGPNNASNVPSGPADAFFTPGPINYDSRVTGFTYGAFTNGAIGGALGATSMGTGTGNSFFQINGIVSLQSGDNFFTITHDDGAVISMPDFGTVLNQPGPTPPVGQTFDVFNPGPAVAEPFTLNYVECCSPPAVLTLSLAPAPLPGAGFSGLVALALAGAWAWSRKFA